MKDLSICPAASTIAARCGELIKGFELITSDVVDS